MRTMRLSLLPALAAGLLLAAGCTTRQAPTHSNPLDPGNDAFRSPVVTIVSGPSDGQTVTASGVTFTWKGQGSAVEYSSSLDGGAWSAWGTATSRDCNDLYEGPHTFRVRARNSAGDVSPTAPQRGFTINNVTGPALMLYPRALTAAAGAQVELVCMLEEVATPVLAAHLVVNYPPAGLTLVAADSGALWTATGGSPLGPFSNSTGGIADYSIAVTGGSPAGISGSGRILKMRFTAGSPGTYTISFGTAAGLRDTLDQPLTLTARTSCTVVVQY